MKNTKTDFEYDRTTTGWESRFVTQTVTYSDGTQGSMTAVPEPRERPVEDRVRCGPYTATDGVPSWGDHRVTDPGTTCVDTQCEVAHHPDILPGWSEPETGWQDREDLRAVAASLEGWDAGGMLSQRIGSTTAWVAASIALDALRDAGYEIVKKDRVTDKKEMPTDGSDASAL